MFSRSRRCSSTPYVISAQATPVASAVIRVCGSMPHRRIRAKLRPLVSASLVSARCTASLSMSPPTWPTCVNTSLRAVFLIAPLPHSPRRGSRCRCQMSWQRFRVPPRRSGDVAGSTGKMSSGEHRSPTSRCSHKAPAPVSLCGCALVLALPVSTTACH